MVKKKSKDQKMCHSCCSKSMLVAKGIILLGLGISLWQAILVLEEVVAISFVLMGLKKLYHSCC